MHKGTTSLNVKSWNKDDDDEAVIRDQLGRKLGQVYDDILSEPVPDKFFQIIDKLAEQEQVNRQKDEAEQDEGRS